MSVEDSDSDCIGRYLVVSIWGLRCERLHFLRVGSLAMVGRRRKARHSEGGSCA